jgi:ubiquinone/menaquinone biosynthesis C-methylase UbiE
LDVSRTFVEIATANARNAGVTIDFRLGNAAAMPFAGESFDFIYCSAAFKNFSEPVEALDEMHRVLRPSGTAVVVDLRKDVSLDEIDTYVKQSRRSGFDAWMTKWAFRCMLIKRAYTKNEFVRMAERSRFGTCQVHVAPMTFELRFSKSASARAGVA